MSIQKTPIDWSLSDLGSIAVIKHDDQTQLGEEKLYSNVYFPGTVNSQELSITGGSEERELEAGKEAEGTEECCLLAYSTGFLSHYLHRDGATHRDLGHQPSIFNQDHTSSDCVRPI